MSDPYAKYANFEGPSDEEVWAAHRRNRGRSVDSSVQGSGGLRKRTPRGGKYAHGLVEGVRIR